MAIGCSGVLTAVIVLTCVSAGVWSSEITVGDNNWYNNNTQLLQQSIQLADTLRQQIFSVNTQPQSRSNVIAVQTEDELVQSCVPLLVQQHVDGSAFFNRRWQDFKVGFRSSKGNYWIGNELMHRVTKKGRHKLRVDMQVKSGSWYWAEYESFVVFSEATQYDLLMGVYKGNLNDEMGKFNIMKFSTSDRDNDMSRDENCAARCSAGFWYNDCNKCRTVNGVGDAFDWSENYSWKLQTSRMWLLCR